MLTSKISPAACAVFVLLALVACDGKDHDIRQADADVAHAAVDINAVDKALQDFFSDIDNTKKQ